MKAHVEELALFGGGAFSQPQVLRGDGGEGGGHRGSEQEEALAQAENRCPLVVVERDLGAQALVGNSHRETIQTAPSPFSAPLYLEFLKYFNKALMQTG